MEHPGLASPGLGEVVTGVPRQRDSAGAEVLLVRKRRFREARRRAKEPELCLQPHPCRSSWLPGTPGTRASSQGPPAHPGSF